MKKLILKFSVALLLIGISLTTLADEELPPYYLVGQFDGTIGEADGFSCLYI